MQNHITFVISNFSIWVGCYVVEQFCESFCGVLSASQLSRGEVAKGNKHDQIDDKGVEEEALKSLLDAVDIFCVKTGWLFGSNWLLNLGSVWNRSVVDRLKFGSKWIVVVETAEYGLDVAGHGKVALMVEIIPPKWDVTEKGVGPIGGDFVTGVG